MTPASTDLSRTSPDRHVRDSLVGRDPKDRSDGYVRDNQMGKVPIPTGAYKTSMWAGIPSAVWNSGEPYDPNHIFRFNRQISR